MIKITIEYEEDDSMDSSYSKDHNENECDNCLENVGAKNLIKLHFLYCDKNDHNHEDLSWLIGLPDGEGYRQYYVCAKCKGGKYGL